MATKPDSIDSWKTALADNLESMDEMTQRLREQAAEIAAAGRALRDREGEE